MHAVVNQLEFTDPVPADVLRGAEAIVPAMREVPGFRGLHVVQTGEREVTLVILADDAATLDRLATEVGSPWMREHVVPLLAGPPNRVVGEVLATSG